MVRSAWSFMGSSPPCKHCILNGLNQQVDTHQQQQATPTRAPPADLGRAQAAAQAEAAQAAALAEAQRLVDAAKAALPVPFRPDGPPLGYIFDEPPGM